MGWWVWGSVTSISRKFSGMPYLLEALRVRVGACAREPRGHELLRLALALLLLLGLRLLRLLLRLVGAAL